MSTREKIVINKYMKTQHRTISGAAKKDNLKKSVKKTVKEFGKSAALATGLVAAGGLGIAIADSSGAMAKMNAMASKVKPKVKPMQMRNLASKYSTIPKTGKLAKAATLSKAALAKSALGLGAVAGAAAYGIHRIRKAKKEFDQANAAQIKAQEEGSKMAVKATKELIARRKKKAKK